MARTPRWENGRVKDGFIEYELSSWRYFHDFVMQEMLQYSQYVWRGQRDSNWGLQTGFDRAMQFKQRSTYASRAEKHLENFKMASRGRRGPAPVKIEDENSWWALAQHNGLSTPLLDWTESPFVALYFAFEGEQSPGSDRRAVWALGGIQDKNDELTKINSNAKFPPTLDIVRPLQDENSRLVSQSGLFTKAPYGMTVESWVKEHFKDESEKMALIKITMPNRDRPNCLKILSKMNINHTSLFPDLYGSCIHSNMKLQIESY